MYCSTDMAIANWYDHLRTSVIPSRPYDKKMYTITGRVVEEPGDWMLREIDIAAEMGSEAFMIDAGWYGERFEHWHHNRGDWYTGKFLADGYMAAICEYVHSKGMLFGLWMEPETMGKNSKVLEEHPNWILNSDGKNAGYPGYDGQLIDLSNREAALYIEKSILNVINEYKLDFLKLDYNLRLPEGGQNLRDGFAEGEEWRHFEVIYGIFDRVLKEYPAIALENCAGGEEEMTWV